MCCFFDLENNCLENIYPYLQISQSLYGYSYSSQSERFYECSFHFSEIAASMKRGIISEKCVNNKMFFECNVCNIMCTGTASVSEHLQGEQHNKKLKYVIRISNIGLRFFIPEVPFMFLFFPVMCSFILIFTYCFIIVIFLVCVSVFALVHGGSELFCLLCQSRPRFYPVYIYVYKVLFVISLLSETICGWSLITIHAH